jgi:hypothetical protein
LSWLKLPNFGGNWDCCLPQRRRNPLDRRKEFERLLRRIVMGDILLFTQSRSLIVAHPGDSNFADRLPKGKRNSMAIHFYREKRDLT